jgi:hypothetical protein
MEGADGRNAVANCCGRLDIQLLNTNRGSGTAMSRKRVRTQEAMYKLKDA